MPVMPTKLVVETALIVFLRNMQTLPQASGVPQADNDHGSALGLPPRGVSRYPLPKGEPMHVSVILPAKNEVAGLRLTLPALMALLPGVEVIVVDDGSTDDTATVAAAHGAKVLSS